MPEQNPTESPKQPDKPSFTRWRTGTRVPINVYEGERPICQCQTAMDAKLIVLAVNSLLESRERFK